MTQEQYVQIEDESQGGGLDLKVLLLYGVMRFKYWVAALTAIGVFVGLLIGAAQPNTFTAAGTLRYRPSQQETMSATGLRGLDNEGRPNVPGMAEEIILLRDDQIYREIAEELGAELILGQMDPSAGDSESTSLPVRVMHRLQSLMQSKSDPVSKVEGKGINWVARSLKANTRLVAVRSSSLIQVEYTGFSPERAHQICTELLKGFVRFHSEKYRPLDEEAEENFRRAQDSLSSHLLTFNEHSDGCGLPENLEQETADNRLLLADVSAALRASRNKLDQVEAQVQSINQILEETSPTIPQTTTATLAYNPVLAQIDQKLMELLIEEVTERSAVRLQRIPEEREKYEALRASLQPFVEVAQPIVEDVVNEAYVEAEKRKTELQLEQVALTRSIELAESELESIRGRAKAIRRCQSMHEAFSRQRSLLEADVELSLQKRKDAVELAELAEAGVASLSVFVSPKVPLTKAGPSRAKFLLMGTFGGIALGVGLAVLRQLLDRRVRYPETIEKTLGLRVLGVVPENRKLRSLAKNVFPS